MEIIPEKGSYKYVLRLPSKELFDEFKAYAKGQQGVSPNTLIAAWIGAAVEGTAIQTQVPRTLHKHLRAKAKEQGVPLDSLVLSLLAGAIGFKLAPEK
jgi:predicted HicB family RNase H-like nuclease